MLDSNVNKTKYDCLKNFSLNSQYLKSKDNFSLTSSDGCYKSYYQKQKKQPTNFIKRRLQKVMKPESVKNYSQHVK